MGAAESSPEDASSSSASSSSASPLDLDSLDVSGWLILHVQSHSPCDGLGLIPYFDLITHCNGQPLTSHESSLVAHIRPHTPVTLTIFSLSLLTSRTLSLTPRPHSGDGLLGLLIRHDALTGSTPVECLHVVGVKAGSPAEAAGLRAGEDWLMGGDRVAFKGWPLFDAWLEREDGREVAVWVWSGRTWRMREVRIRLSKGWGGEGSLGADLAHGWVHRLPVWEQPQRRAVTVERTSGVRVGKRSQRGLTLEDGQLLVNLELPAQDARDDAVPLLTLRVRDPDEDLIVPYTGAAHSAHAGGAGSGHGHQHGHQHNHAAHGHSHAHGNHGHSHGGNAHSHKAGGLSAGAPYAVSTSPLPSPAASPTLSGAATTSAVPPGKKPLTAQLPRSRESSPQVQPTSANALSLASANSLSQLPPSAASPTQRPPPAGSSPLAPPFPSLAPNTAAFHPRLGPSMHDFT